MYCRSCGEDIDNLKRCPRCSTNNVGSYIPWLATAILIAALVYIWVVPQSRIPVSSEPPSSTPTIAATPSTAQVAYYPPTEMLCQRITTAFVTLSENYSMSYDIVDDYVIRADMEFAKISPPFPTSPPSNAEDPYYDISMLEYQFGLQENEKYYNNPTQEHINADLVYFLSTYFNRCRPAMPDKLQIHFIEEARAAINGWKAATYEDNNYYMTITVVGDKMHVTLLYTGELPQDSD